MLPHKQTRILDSSSGLADPTISILEFPDEEAFDNWLNSQNEIVEWNLTRLRNSTNSDQKLPEGTSEVVAKKGRPRTVEWTKNFTCSFGGTPRARSGESSQRTTSKPSRKVGCMAKIKAQKKFSCDTIYVTFLNQHSGHSLNTLKTWTWSRMSPSTRRWLEKAVGSGMEWKELKRMTRVEVELANFFGAGEENLRSQIEVPEIMRISNQDFNNFRRKFLTQSAQLHSDCWLSLSIYAEMITQAGGVSTLQEVGGDSVSDSATFIFAFCSNWQVEVFLKYNSLVFLDATHNTCISLEDRHRKAFLYTILVKHDIAGCGIPVAFMITNSETQWPLATWLNWLRENYLMPQSPKIMIDCSATEMAAIERSFENPQIRLCHWHMLRALQKQVNSKIKTPLSLEEQPIAQTRRSAIQDFLELMHTDSIEKFGQIWREYHEKYYQHEEWLRYLNENWLKQPEKWWSGNRSGMLEINTNNYVESWHNTLKSGYLGGSRKQRPDILVHLLLREVLPDFRVKVARVTMGLDRRRLSKPEKVQLKKCTEISSEIAATLVRHSVVESGEAMYSEVILVKSFTNNEQDYVVSLNPVSAIICCSCNYMIESKSVCKHMFLAQAVLGYSISYDTRLSKKPDDCGKSMLAANAGSSSTLNDARFESDNFLKASLSEQMGILTPYASSSIPLDDEEREMMRVARDQLARINRYRESKDRSWSKRQRR